MFWPEPEQITGSCDKPGIYRFTIEGAGVYVGRFTHASRPLREYVRNVKKMLTGGDYRPKKPDGFRRVHRALHMAVSNGQNIRLEIIENVPENLLNARERYWIEQVPMNLRLNGKAKK